MTFGQMQRVNRNISFSTEPIATLDDDLVGWLRSKRGDWIGVENKIVYDVNQTRNKKKHLALGQDNILAIHVYDVFFGEDRLWLYVKFYQTGEYKYEQRERGWKERIDAYYYLLDPFDLPDLQGIEDNKSYVFLVPTRATGNLKDIKPREITKAVQTNLSLDSKSDRFLSLHLRLEKSSNKAQFQLASVHKIFKGTQGIVNDYLKNDYSLYGDSSLLNYLYYETTYLNLLNIFPFVSSQ